MFTKNSACYKLFVYYYFLSIRKIILKTAANMKLNVVGK